MVLLFVLWVVFGLVIAAKHLNIHAALRWTFASLAVALLIAAVIFPVAQH